jgi:hypothetical protein
MRAMAVRLKVTRTALTVLLPRISVSPSATDWARLSKPALVVARMLSGASRYAGGRRYVVAMYRPNSEWFGVSW